MTKANNDKDIKTMVNDLILTSDKIKDINYFLDNQIHDTEIKKTDDDFSKLYTLIDYNTEQIKVLKDILNELCDTLLQANK